MLHRIYKLFTAWCSNSEYQSELESFVVSKSPKTIADVEHFERLYSSRRAGGMI